MSSEGKNLEAISRAIDQHDNSCPGELVEILMNPFEVDRLGWDNIRGIPIVSDDTIGTGRFRLVCEKEKDFDKEIEDIAVEDRLVNV